MAKIEKKIFLLQSSKQTNSKFKKTFCYGVPGRATLPHLFEHKHNYVGPAVTEWIYELAGLI